MALLPYATELKIRGCKVAALFEGSFKIDNDGTILEVCFTNYDGEKGAVLPLEGEILEAMKAVLADEHRDDITESIEEAQSNKWEDAAADKADRKYDSREVSV